MPDGYDDLRSPLSLRPLLSRHDFLSETQHDDGLEDITITVRMRDYFDTLFSTLTGTRISREMLFEGSLGPQLVRDHHLSNFWRSLVVTTTLESVTELRKRARNLAFQDDTRPNLPRDMMSRWHIAKQDIATIREEQITYKGLRPEGAPSAGASNHFAELKNALDECMSRLSNQADQLDGFLRDLGQVLIGYISLQDSTRSTRLAEQSNRLVAQSNEFARSANAIARRGMGLTLIAAVYLPLTLVTGIFGMNIKEINDGTHNGRHV